MKHALKNKIIIGGIVVSFVLAVIGFRGLIAAHAATTVSLGTAGVYGVVSSTFTNANTSPQTIVNGSVCGTTLTVPLPLTITGTTDTPCDPQVGLDQAAALVDINSQSCTSLGAAVTLSGTYTPGCYSSTGAMDITAGTTVTLDGGGDANAVFIFRPGGALTTGANSFVVLTGSANASNVFWAPVGGTTLGAYTTGGIPPGTPTFVGNIFRGVTAGLSITLGHFANLSGRALAFGSTVTTDANTITVPTAPTSATLNVIKHVVTDNGGTAVASAWTMTVSSSNGGSGTGSAVGSESGTTYTLQSGKAYSVAESGGPSGYTEADSADCIIASAVLNTTYTCTITNTDTPATLRVIKSMINLGGGNASSANFNLHVKLAGTEVAGSPAVGLESPGRSYSLAAGTYVVSEDANALYTPSFSGDCNASGSITLAIGADKTCTITNTYISPSVPVGIGGSGGTGAGLYAPKIVPLIGIIKIPSPLALPGGSGTVVYHYTVWNVGGRQALINITVTDDKCSPTIFISGDLNGNSKLDPGENWKYTCSTTLSQTTTNTSVATGYSDDNSFTAAVASAVAIVAVGTPVPPPLINIVKVPSRLTPFPSGGGDVAYTYTVTNPGVAAMHDTVVTDDKCAPVSFLLGDTNRNDLLDPREAWIYTCRTHISVSTRNIAIAQGKANGFTALGYAFAVVLVSAPSSPAVVPGLPETGFSPPDNNILWSLALVAAVLVAVFLRLRLGEEQNPA